jgi:hypothetical protein
MKSKDDVWNVKSAVRVVRKVLSEIPRLDYLHRSLYGHRRFDAQSFPHFLKIFSLLRNVRRVVLGGVPLAYAHNIWNAK